MGPPARLIHLRLGGHAIAPSRYSFVLTAVLLAAAFLRLYALNRWSLWTDELYTWNLATTLRILSEGVPDDQHPPLYYILFNQLLRVGDGETWLRLPSALAGVGAVALLWRVGVAAGDRRLGVLAAALLALSPIHIWYSREARMYGLASLFWAGSLLFYTCLLRGERQRDVFGWVACTAAGVLTTYASLGLWGLQLAAFWPLREWAARHEAGRGRSISPVRRRAQLGNWLQANAFAVIVMAGWWPFLQQQLARSSPFFWPGLPTLGLNPATTLATTLRLALVAAAIVIVAGAGLGRLLQQQRAARRLAQRVRGAAPLIAAIFLALLLLGAVPRGLSIRRQLLVFWPAAVLAGAWALGRLPGRVTGAALLLAAAASLTPVFGPPLEDWRGVRDFLAAEGAAGDVVVVAPWWTATVFDYYPGLDVLAGDETAVAAGPLDLAPGDRVWLVFIDHPSVAGQTAPVMAWLEGQARVVARTPFARDLVVVEYVGD